MQRFGTYPSPTLLVNSVPDTNQRQCIREDRAEPGSEEGSHVEDGDSSSGLKLAIPCADDEDGSGEESSFEDAEKSTEGSEDRPVFDETHA